jgi:hypothetical protein
MPPFFTPPAGTFPLALTPPAKPPPHPQPPPRPTPAQGQRRRFEGAVKHHTLVHEQLIAFYRGFKHDAHPMAIMARAARGAAKGRGGEVGGGRATRAQVLEAGALRAWSMRAASSRRRAGAWDPGDTCGQTALGWLQSARATPTLPRPREVEWALPPPPPPPPPAPPPPPPPPPPPTPPHPTPPPGRRSA